jgi:hypothetical protein
MTARASPYVSMQVADIGDVAINTFNLQKSRTLSPKRTTKSLRSAACR